MMHSPVFFTQTPFWRTNPFLQTQPGLQAIAGHFLPGGQTNFTHFENTSFGPVHFKDSTNV